MAIYFGGYFMWQTSISGMTILHDFQIFYKVLPGFLFVIIFILMSLNEIQQLSSAFTKLMNIIHIFEM